MTTSTPANHRHRLILVAIIAAALALRVYMPWPFVFAGAHINLLETDAWYHLRVMEQLAQQFPHRLTVDPYAGGEFLKVPPLFDYLVAGLAWLLAGGQPTDSLVATSAAWAPPLLATVVVLLVHAVTRAAAGPTAGLLAAALVALLPGHFLDRTLLGYADHHALEACVSLLIVTVIARSLVHPTKWWRTGVLLGACFLAMRLAWTSSALIFATVGVWLAAHILLHAWRRRPIGEIHRTVGLGAALALAVTLAFPSLEPFGVALDTVAFSVIIALTMTTEVGRWSLARYGWSMSTPVWIGLGLTTVAVTASWWLAPEVWQQIVSEMSRFSATGAPGSVLEARPLLVYDGIWSLRPAWTFFGSGLVLGLIGLLVSVHRWWRGGHVVHLLLGIWFLSMFAATLGINRFGYYLVPALAIVGGMACAALLAWGQQHNGWRRTATVLIVTAGAFGINIGPAIASTTRPSGVPASWLPAFDCMRLQTEEPFGDGTAYYAAQPPGSPPASTVMTWWDYGYVVMAAGHRVPLAIPTGRGAATAARFYTATEEWAAMAQLDGLLARYVLMDDILPLSLSDQGGLIGKFQAVSETAGIPYTRFFDVYLLPENGSVKPIFLFHEDYYRTMAFRLGTIGGMGVAPTTSTVVSWRVDQTSQGPVKVITHLERVDGPDAARDRLRSLGPGNHAIVGTSPRTSPIALDAITGLNRAYVTPELGLLRQGAVQIFERVK